MKFLKIQKTVDGIMAAFNKTIADLEAVAQDQAELATDNNAAADLLRADAVTAQNESERARKIAANLQKIVITQ